MEVFQNSQKFGVGTYTKVVPVHVPAPGYFRRARLCPGCCSTGVHNLQVQARVSVSYITYRSSGSGSTRGIRVSTLQDATSLYRSSGYGYGGLTKLTEVPGTVWKSIKAHRSSGYWMEVLQSSQKFRALDGSLTKLTDCPG